MIDWLLGWLWWAVDAAWWLIGVVTKAVIEWVRRNPYAAALALFAFIRMWGITVQTGQSGVLFSWGRPVRVLEPGFHPLIPFFQTARVLPARSVTLSPPPQRVASADGLVFDADATLVFRISDPIKATVEIDDLRGGCLTALALGVAAIIGHKTRAELAAKEGLDGELKIRVQLALEPWGVTIEQVGFNTIAPTRTTTRLSQQGQRLRERATVLRLFTDAGVPLTSALALLGTTKQVIGHSRARYQRARLKPPPAVLPPPEEVILVATEEEELEIPI